MEGVMLPARAFTEHFRSRSWVLAAARCSHGREWGSKAQLSSWSLSDPFSLRVFEMKLKRDGREGMCASRIIRANAGRSTPVSVSASAAADESGSLPPTSKEEAVEQAGAALLLLLEKTLRQQQGPMTVKQRKTQRQIRLRVDIPVLDDSPRALPTLASDLLTSFFAGKSFGGPFAVYLPQSAFSNAGPPPLSQNDVEKGYLSKFLSLDGQEDPSAGAMAILVVAPTFAQAGALESVARSAKSRPIIVVNPEWSEEEEADKLVGNFLSSFCVAYSFVPLNIQGFFSKTEGAVLKTARNGTLQGDPWLIFIKEGGRYKCVSTMKKKPLSRDLENALYTFVAANSPVSKSIVFLRGLVSK